MTSTVLADVSTTTIGEDIDTLFELREKIRRLKEQQKDLQSVFDVKETALMERLKREGIAGARGSKATVSIGDAIIVGQVENWDDFHAYIHRNKAYHLIERRIANAAYRELLANRKKPVPGVKPFEKYNLSLKTL